MSRKGKGKKSLLRNYDDKRSEKVDSRKSAVDLMEVNLPDKEQITEDYWFFCKRWLARSEDDGKIVRELIATDENGQSLEHGLKGSDVEILYGSHSHYYKSCIGRK